jgi:hypothetical protein
MKFSRDVKPYFLIHYPQPFQNVKVQTSEVDTKLAPINVEE